MIYLILFGLCFIGELFFSVWYSLSESAQGRKGAVKFGISASALYIFAAIFSALLAFRNKFLGVYSVLVLISVGLFFIGDLFYILKKTKFQEIKMIFHSIGALTLGFGFLYKAIDLWKIEASPTLFLIFVVAILLISYTILYIGKKEKSFIKVLYLFSDIFLFSESLNLGIKAQLTGAADLQSLSCAVICGSGLYFISALFQSEIIKFKASSHRTRLYKNCFYLFSILIILCSLALVGG